MSERDDVTGLLADMSAGRDGAEAMLLPIVYGELHAMAKRYMRAERPGHTLQTTALLHEAYLKLGGAGDDAWENRAHFMRVAAQAMRRILIDHARSRRSLRRGGERKRKPLEEDAMALVHERHLDFLELDNVLTELADVDPRLVQIVELRFFAGMTVEETAKVLSISPRTVKSDWRMAKAWLMEKLA